MPQVKDDKKEPLWRDWDRKAQKKGIRNTVYSVNRDEYTGEWLENKRHGKYFVHKCGNVDMSFSSDVAMFVSRLLSTFVTASRLNNLQEREHTNGKAPALCTMVTGRTGKETDLEPTASPAMTAATKNSTRVDGRMTSVTCV